MKKKLVTSYKLQRDMSSLTVWNILVKISSCGYQAVSTPP